MFNHDSRQLDDRRIKATAEFKSHRRGQIGEITGERFNTKQTSQGMPMRPLNERFDEKRKRSIFNDQSGTNIHNGSTRVDFDLYNSEHKLDVSYFDPVEFHNSDHFYSNITESTNTVTNKAEQNLVSNLNSISLTIYNSVKQVLPNNKSLIVSPFNIMLNLIILYRGSNGKTESELRKVFSFPDKTSSFNNISKIMRRLDKSVSVSNMLLTPNEYPINYTFANFVRDFCIVDSFHLQNKHEVQRINSIMRKINGINELINPTTVNKDTSIILLNTICFTPKWRLPFSSIVNGIFGGKQAVFMVQQAVTHFYFENDAVQLVELDSHEGKIAVGFVLPKNKSLEVTNEELEYYISQLGETVIKLLQIPKFQQQSKFKMDNLFKRLGLKELFKNADLPEIVTRPQLDDESLYVSDIIHQSCIVINEGVTNKINNSPKKVTELGGRTFIANRPFIYYVRHLPTNSIIFIGNYC
jgi:serine protease inhibitor